MALYKSTFLENFTLTDPCKFYRYPTPYPSAGVPAAISESRWNQIREDEIEGFCNDIGHWRRGSDRSPGSMFLHCS